MQHSLAPACVQKGGDKLGYESEAFAIYDTLRSIKPPVYTLCIGNAFGEAAMLLAAGEKVRLTLLHDLHESLQPGLARWRCLQGHVGGFSLEDTAPQKMHMDSI